MAGKAFNQILPTKLTLKRSSLHSYPRSFVDTSQAPTHAILLVEELRMNKALSSRWPAFLCTLLLLVCALATYPVAEIGMTDDWSYVQSARVLAQTGHVVYNGWTTAMLGWQLFLGAFFIKLFGPSFTAIRASTLLVALITTFLLQRTFVCSGISSRNATFGALTLVLGPIFLATALIFMSDMFGLFCVVLLLYACLRAIQARTNRALLAWLAFAAFSNAIGGTARQIAWLGVLVMFPCAVWILRRRSHALSAGAISYILSVIFIFCSLHWFHQQPHSAPPEPLFNGFPTGHQLRVLAVEMLSLLLSGALFLLPAIAAFATKIRFRDPRFAVPLACFAALWAGACALLRRHDPDVFDMLIAPFRGDSVSAGGLAVSFWIHSVAPLVFPIGVRLVITAVVLFALACFLFFLINMRHSLRCRPAIDQPAASLSWNNLLILFIPFALAYLALLLPRGILGFSFDRYLLPLLPIALILILRLYEEQPHPDLPWFSKAILVLFALCSVACMHDTFSKYRSWKSAVDEIRAAGVPDTAIDAGFEHNAMIQIEIKGSILNLIGLPNREVDLGPSPSFPADCQPGFPMLTPVIVPGYALSYDPNACGGLSRFAPITYREWLPPRYVTVYVVNTLKPGSGQR